MVMSQSTEDHGNVMEQLETATAEEKKQNRDIMKKLIQSLYFLDKHHIPNTTRLLKSKCRSLVTRWLARERAVSADDGVYQLWSVHSKRYTQKLGMQNHMELQHS